MSQNDFNIANQGFPSFRSDLNGALQALASNSAGTSAPATTYAYMWWYDSTNDILKMRNADNDAWIDFATFDQANDRWAMAGSGDTGLYFDAANDALLPWNTDSGVVRDSAIDLGSSSARFKNLYLSGGVYLGGTGAANLLDDYEEGTFTPFIFGTVSAGTGIYSKQGGFYTKIGNRVNFIFELGWAAHTGTGNMRFGGLPFTVYNSSSVTIYPCAIAISGVTAGVDKHVVAYPVYNSTYGSITAVDTNGGANVETTMDTSVTYVVVNGSYQVA